MSVLKRCQENCYLSIVTFKSDATRCWQGLQHIPVSQCSEQPRHTQTPQTGLLTVHSVEGICFFFVGGLWSADDLQHGALRLRGLGRQGIVVWILLSVRLRTADRRVSQNLDTRGSHCICMYAEMCRV